MYEYIYVGEKNCKQIFFGNSTNHSPSHSHIYINYIKLQGRLIYIVFLYIREMSWKFNSLYGCAFRCLFINGI